MPDEISGDLVLARVAAAQQVRALDLVFRDHAGSERARRAAEALRQARQDPDVLRDLVAAHRDDGMVAAVWGQVLPGKTAVLWGPGLQTGETAVTAKRLVEYLISRLVARQVQVLQALPKTSSTAKWLATCGFDLHLELVYLAAKTADRASAPPRTELDFRPYGADLRETLADVLEASYEETRDVPLLNGRRAMGDVIDGYMHTGSFDPGRWWLVYWRDEAVGCLLLTDHPERRQLELVYMGLVAAVRGRGWGQRMVEFALWHTAQAGRSHLILAVDAENDPAIRIYTRTGFHPLLRQHVCIRFL